MHLPNYRDGSIVNLMQSILTGSMRPGPVACTAISPTSPEEIAGAGHVVLLVIDGLGRSQLESGATPVLREALRSTMTSVFPSTTASAVTTFLTGLSHGRARGHRLVHVAARVRDGRRTASVHDPGRRRGPRLARHRPVRCLHRPDRLRAGARGLPRGAAGPDRRLGVFAGAYARGRALGLRAPRRARRRDHRRRARRPPARTCVYAYWPMLDTLSHKHGASSRRVRRHLAEIDALFDRLRTGLAGTGALLVVTADHGFVDVRPNRASTWGPSPALRRGSRSPCAASRGRRSATCGERTTRTSSGMPARRWPAPPPSSRARR